MLAQKAVHRSVMAECSGVDCNCTAHCCVYFTLRELETVAREEPLSGISVLESGRFCSAVMQHNFIPQNSRKESYIKRQVFNFTEINFMERFCIEIFQVLRIL